MKEIKQISGILNIGNNSNKKRYKVERICPKHGKYIASVCEELIDGKFVKKWESQCYECKREKNAAEIWEQYQEEQWNINFKKSGIPEISKENRINNYRVDSQEQANARRHVIQWVNKDIRNLILAGKTRTGKTHLCVGGLRGASMNNHSVKYILESDLILMVKDSYISNKTSEYRILNEFGEYDFLVIDEIGRSMGTDKDKQIIRNLIIKRFNNNKSTAMASNLRLNDFNAYFGDVVYGKFRANCNEINCVWESFK